MKKILSIVFASLCCIHHAFPAKDNKLYLSEGYYYEGKIDKKTNTPRGKGSLYFENHKDFVAYGTFTEANTVTNAVLRFPSGWFWSGNKLQYEVQDSIVIFRLGKGKIYGFKTQAPYQGRNNETTRRESICLDANDCYISVSKMENKIVDTDNTLLDKGFVLSEKPQWTKKIYHIPSDLICMDSVQYAKGFYLIKDDVTRNAWGQNDNQWSLVPQSIYISDRLKPLSVYSDKYSVKIEYTLDDDYIILPLHDKTIMHDNKGTSLRFTDETHLVHNEYVQEIEVKYNCAGSDFKFNGYLNKDIVQLDAGTYKGKWIKTYRMAFQKLKLNGNCLFHDWKPELYSGIVYENEDSPDEVPLLYVEDGKDMIPVFIAEKKEKEKEEAKKAEKVALLKKKLASSTWTFHSNQNGSYVTYNITLQADGHVTGTITANFTDREYQNGAYRTINSNGKLNLKGVWLISSGYGDELCVTIRSNAEKTTSRWSGGHFQGANSAQKTLSEIELDNALLRKFTGQFYIKENCRKLYNPYVELKRVK